MPTQKQLANLIPQNKRTKSEQREIGKQGGKKSGETRKKLKTFREVFNTELADEKIKDMPIKKAIFMAMCREASNGNVRAAEFVRDTLGEKPTEKIESESLANFASRSIDFKKLVEVNNKLNELRNK